MIIEISIETFVLNALYILKQNNKNKLTYGGLVEYKDVVRYQLEKKGIILLYSLDERHQQSMIDCYSDIIKVEGNTVFDRCFSLQKDIEAVNRMFEVVYSLSATLFGVMQNDLSKSVLLESNLRYLNEIK